MNQRGEGAAALVFGLGLGSLVLLSAVALGMWGCPVYSVYSARKNGEAILAHATSSKLAKVQEAEATRESASKLAEADSLRALGVAAANRIIGQSLDNNPKYLTWLFYESIKETQNQIIYVPTESNLPITEAGRHALPAKP